MGVTPTKALLGAAVGTAFALQVGPGGTWLPPVRRRWFPGLSSPMPAGRLALTFDDGPHPAGTIAVLDALEAFRWPATFFMVGSAVGQFPDVVCEVQRRGHGIGVHGFDHRYLIARSPRAQRDDLRRAVDAVGEVTGTAPRWWRPPYGVLSGPAIGAAKAAGVRPLLWSAWGKDWAAGASPQRIARRVSEGQLDGGTVLLHDSDRYAAPGSWQATVGSLDLIADELGQRSIEVGALPMP